MGPLHGLKVLEFEGIGPGTLAGMILADLGAEVTLLRRTSGIALKAQLGAAADLLNRGKQQVAIDLKAPAGIALALQLVERVDALIEGNRPGVMERLGPEPCLARNPRLIYGRMTSWGQDGPLAQAAGHDLNYIALSGLLALGRPGDAPPLVPPTLAGDAIGSLGLAFGIIAAAFEAKSSMRRSPTWWPHSVRSSTGSAPPANWAAKSPVSSTTRRSTTCIECSDGKWISLGVLEPQFYALLLAKLGLADVDPTQQNDVATWQALKQRLTALFRSQPQAYWCALLEGSDACFAPVLTPAEAAQHPHNLSRQTYATLTPLQPNPAPRFSHSVAELRQGFTPEATAPLLSSLGLSVERLAALRAAGVLG